MSWRFTGAVPCAGGEESPDKRGHHCSRRSIFVDSMAEVAPPVFVPLVSRRAGDNSVVEQHLHDIDTSPVTEILDMPASVDPYSGLEQLLNRSGLRAHLFGPFAFIWSAEPVEDVGG